MLPFFSSLWSYDIHVHQRVVSLEMSGEVHHAGSCLLSYVCNAQVMYCCSTPAMRYSAKAGRSRPASTRDLTSVDLVIYIAMAAATRILVGYDRYGTCCGQICQASLAWTRLERHRYQASLQGHRWTCQGQDSCPHSCPP